MKSKQQTVMEVDGIPFLRIPISTKILTEQDDMAEIVKEAAKDVLQKDDLLVISESPLAITQGRAVPVEKIKVRFFANILWRFVANVKYGVGLRSPYSMQCAIDEVGLFRILFAAKIGALGKLFGRKGDFYRIAGMQAALIDAAHTSPIPPYNECVIKGPLHPEQEAQRIKQAVQCEVAIMDINDIGGCWMIGGSDGISKHFMEKVMKDNPQGQGDELTPICIVRKVKSR